MSTASGRKKIIIIIELQINIIQSVDQKKEKKLSNDNKLRLPPKVQVQLTMKTFLIQRVQKYYFLISLFIIVFYGF